MQLYHHNHNFKKMKSRSEDLFESIKHDDLVAVRAIVANETFGNTKSSVQLLSSRDSLGRTPLMLAGWYGHKDIINELIISGANFDDVDDCGKTASDYVANFGGVEPYIKQKTATRVMILKSQIFLAVCDIEPHPTKDRTGVV